jgi:multiple sugar transport system substrate-binding protein
MQDKDRIEQPEGGADDARLSRGKLLARAGVAGAGLALVSAGPAWSKSAYNRHLGKLALSEAMVGGPTGFPGASRYQYPANSAEGRAIAGLKRLTNNGKNPITLKFRIWNGAVGQLNKPYPTKSAPSVAQLLEKEAGVKLQFVLTTPDNNDQKNLQAISTRDGSFQIAQTSTNQNGDYRAAGFLRPLDEYVAEYRPDWNDPKWGYAGGKVTTAMFNQFAGETVSVACDGDYQVWAYRIDLFDNAKNQKDFKAKYGRDLEFPKTWEHHAQVAAFFTRPDQKLYGSVDLKSPFWGYVNWLMRYVSQGNPNRQYFNPSTAKPLIDSPAGLKATREHLASMAWTYSNALSTSWPEQYAALGAGQAAMASVFSNATKFIVKGSPLDKGFGKYLRTELAPGRRVGGKLVRRPVFYFNAQFGVNAFSDSKLHEAAYLVLQYISGGRVSSWYTGNPGGYFDPNRNAQLNDPLVRASYKPYAADKLKQIIPRTAPTILGMVGASEYTQALDTNLQKVLSKQMSPEKAMSDTAAAWEKITNRRGRAKQIKALKAQQAGWPKVI